MAEDTSGDPYAELTFGRLKTRGRAAATHRPEAVRALVDEIVDGNFVTRGAPESIRARVTAAELALRSGLSRGVRVVDAVAVLNDVVQRLKLPGYYRTTARQFKSFQEDYQYATRSFSVPMLSTGGNDVVAPAEALFLLSEIARQKTLVDENKIPPEQWDQRRLERGRALADSKRNPKAIQRPSSRVSMKRLELPLVAADFSSEDSLGTIEVHRILDSLGIPR
jgi:uncharacterized protein (UPF0147 family)